MSSDGAAYDMLLTNEDVFDIGIGCGGDSESQIFADDFDSGLLTQWSESLP